MHPTVLYCSPMKERDEAGGKECLGRRVGNQRLRGMDSLCYANVTMLCQLRKKGKKVSPESRK